MLCCQMFDDRGARVTDHERPNLPGSIGAGKRQRPIVKSQPSGQVGSGTTERTTSKSDSYDQRDYRSCPDQLASLTHAIFVPDK